MIEEIYQPVIKTKVSELIPGMQVNSGNEYAIIINPGTEKARVVNFCSEKYNLVPNQQVFQPIIELFQGKFKVDVQAKLIKGGAITRMDLVLRDSKVKMEGVDSLHPKMSFYNSYDGSMKFQMTAAIYRQVCSNGLCLPDGAGIHIKGLHTDNLEKLINPEYLLDSANDIVHRFEEAIYPYRELEAQKVRRGIEDRVVDVIEDTEFPGLYRESIVDRIRMEMEKNKVAICNDYYIYNGFNYQLNHEMDLKPQKEHSLDKQVLDHLFNY